MKKIAVLFVLILAFCGCENSSEPSLEERFSCKVDGKLFVAKPDDNSLLGVRWLDVYYYNTGSNPSYFLTIGATSGDTPGIYSLGFSCDSVMKINTPYLITEGSIYSRQIEYWNNAQGTLTLTELGGGRMAGRFQFTVREKGGTRIATVTDGKFNAAYISR